MNARRTCNITDAERHLVDERMVNRLEPENQPDLISETSNTTMTDMVIGKATANNTVPRITVDILKNSDVATAEAFFAIRNAEHRMKLEEKRLDDAMRSKEHERELKSREMKSRELITENEKMKLQFEENSKAREHELNSKREVAQIMKLKLEIDKTNLERERLLQENRLLQLEDNRLARSHKEKLVLIKADKMKHDEEFLRQQREDRKTAEEERNNRDELLERQRRKKDEDDMISLRNLGLITTGVGAACGAISGALGTNYAVGLAAGVAGAAAVITPLSVTVAILISAGYVYKKVKNSNRV